LILFTNENRKENYFIVLTRRGGCVYYSIMPSEENKTKKVETKQFNVRADKRLVEKAARKAKSLDMSMSAFVRKLLRENT
jgi:hypothetical protein